jgi:hypothetical protein
LDERSVRRKASAYTGQHNTEKPGANIHAPSGIQIRAAIGSAGFYSAALILLLLCDFVVRSSLSEVSAKRGCHKILFYRNFGLRSFENCVVKSRKLKEHNF